MNYKIYVEFVRQSEGTHSESFDSVSVSKKRERETKTKKIQYYLKYTLQTRRNNIARVLISSFCLEGGKGCSFSMASFDDLNGTLIEFIGPEDNLELVC